MATDFRLRARPREPWTFLVRQQHQQYPHTLCRSSSLDVRGGSSGGAVGSLSRGKSGALFSPRWKLYDAPSSFSASSFRCCSWDPQSAGVCYTHQPGKPSRLGISSWGNRDGVLYVPTSYAPDRPCPVVLTLHAADSNAEATLSALQPLAEKHRLLLAAPESRGQDWDTMVHTFNEDVLFIDRALDLVFDSYCVKRDKIAVAGFSSGAALALSLGLRNGPVFSHVMAFSPTYVDTPCYEDGPEIFISHPSKSRGRGGVTCTDDETRAEEVGNHTGQILPKLQRCGYRCTYHEFDEDDEKMSGMDAAKGREEGDGDESNDVQDEENCGDDEVKIGRGRRRERGNERGKEDNRDCSLPPVGVLEKAVKWFGEEDECEGEPYHHSRFDRRMPTVATWDEECGLA